MIMTRKLELTIDGNSMWHLQTSMIWSLNISKCVLLKLVPQNINYLGEGAMANQEFLKISFFL